MMTKTTIFKELSQAIPYKKKKNWFFKDTRNILFVFALAFFSISLMMTIIRVFKIDNPYLFDKVMSDHFWYTCVFAPLAEDFMFRWTPFTMFAIACSYFSPVLFDKIKWFLAIISSMVFGAYLHGGYWSIYYQGIGGLCICYVYFKNRYGYVSGVIVHSLWNFTLGFILPYLGYFDNPHTLW